MKKNFLKEIKNRGFALIELVVSISLFAIILFSVVTLMLAFDASNSKTTADRELMDAAQNILGKIATEIKAAKSIYSPTTSTNQLSLETSKYLPNGQTTTYIDFFLCGNYVCFKREEAAPVALNSDVVKVSDLKFSQISTGAAQSIKIEIILQYTNFRNNQTFSISPSTTISLRNY